MMKVLAFVALLVLRATAEVNWEERLAVSLIDLLLSNLMFIIYL